MEAALLPPSLYELDYYVVRSWLKLAKGLALTLRLDRKLLEQGQRTLSAQVTPREGYRQRIDRKGEDCALHFVSALGNVYE